MFRAPLYATVQALLGFHASGWKVLSESLGSVVTDDCCSLPSIVADLGTSRFSTCPGPPVTNAVADHCTTYTHSMHKYVSRHGHRVMYTEAAHHLQHLC